MRRLQRFLSVLLLQATVFSLTGMSQDKIYLKNSQVPTVGTITKVDDTSVFLNLEGVGSTALQRVNINQVEINPPTSRDAGVKALNDHKAAQAVSALEPLYIKYQGLPQAWIEEMTIQLGNAYLGNQDWNKARDLFIKFRKFYPQSTAMDVSKSGEAQALVGLKQMDAAAKLLEPIVAAHEKDLSLSDEQSRAMGAAFVTLGRCYLASQKNEQALEAFLKTTTLYYADANMVAEAQYESALLFEKMNNPDRAKRQLEDLLKDSPGVTVAADAKKKLESLKATYKTEENKI